jgi:methyltransferase (TIGR00027 family)
MYFSGRNLACVIDDGRVSLTAMTAAAARAAHLIVDGDPVIFGDTLAEGMLGERAEEFIGYHRAHGAHPVLAGARAQVTCRSRYAEDSLERSIGRGVRQYVILGAGLDSFAGRSELAGRVRLFEVDHPATQEWKRQLGQAHADVIFIPMDFICDSLGDRLGQAGFDFTEPAFVSWLGVTMYLDEAAIGQTLSVVGGFAAGTELVVDYMLPAGLRDAEGNLYADLVGRASAEQGEPWLSLFGPDDMAALLSRHGFGPVRDVGQRDMVPAAAWERSDALRPIELSRIAHALIAERPRR